MQSRQIGNFVSVKAMRILSFVLRRLKGKVVLLEFWIKNCGYCVGAVPELNALAAKYNKQQFQIVGINSHDTKEDIANFYQRTKPVFKTVLDNKRVTTGYGVQAFPTVVLIDQKGVVLYSGDFDAGRIDQLIKDSLLD
jgi:thiol-disulfide isomerase/thioredoxin